MYNNKKTIVSAERVMHLYGDMLFRLCLVMLANRQDAEDTLQDVMIKYMEKAPCFSDCEHEKAWLISVTTNKCKDILRYRKRHFTENIDILSEFTETSEYNDILSSLMSLPEKYRTVLVLYYIEEYSTKEIAHFIKKTDSAVKMRLKKGRELLKEIYIKE